MVQGAGRCGHRPLRRVTRSAVQGKNPPVTASPCQPPLGKGAWGRGMRIATTSLRTGLAMTPLTRSAGDGGTHGSRPTAVHFCRAGPVCPAESAVRNRRATARVAPTKGYKECGAGRNPPVTASPCQPPLGKGAEGTGDADCHDQFANWSRNDMVYYGREPPLMR